MESYFLGASRILTAFITTIDLGIAFLGYENLELKDPIVGSLRKDPINLLKLPLLLIDTDGWAVFWYFRLFWCALIVMNLLSYLEIGNPVAPGIY